MQIDVDQPEEGVLAHVVTSVRDVWRAVGVGLLTAGFCVGAVDMILPGGTGGRMWLKSLSGVCAVVGVITLQIRNGLLLQREGDPVTPLANRGGWLSGSVRKAPAPGVRGGAMLLADAVGVSALRRSFYAWDLVIVASVPASIVGISLVLEAPLYVTVLIGSWSLGLFTTLGLPRARWTRVVVGWDEIRSIEIDGHRFALDCDDGELALELRFSERVAFTESLRVHGGSKVRVRGTPVPKRPRPAPAPPTLDEAAARLAALRRTDPPGAADG